MRTDSSKFKARLVFRPKDSSHAAIAEVHCRIIAIATFYLFLIHYFQAVISFSISQIYTRESALNNSNKNMSEKIGNSEIIILRSNDGAKIKLVRINTKVYQHNRSFTGYFETFK